MIQTFIIAQITAKQLKSLSLRGPYVLLIAFLSRRPTSLGHFIRTSLSSHLGSLVQPSFNAEHLA